jgi:hypothetical protein
MDTTTDADNLAELIADCALIPDSLQEATPAIHLPSPRAWSVDERCHAQVEDFSPYI